MSTSSTVKFKRFSNLTISRFVASLSASKSIQPACLSSLSLSLSFFYPLSFKIGLNTCANTKESLLSLPLSCITHSKFIQLILSQATTQCIQQIQPCTHSFYSLSLTHIHTHTPSLSQPSEGIPLT
jgi:hypothetical protein